MQKSNDHLEDQYEGFWWEIGKDDIIFQGTLEKYTSGKMLLSIVSYYSSHSQINEAPFKPGTLQGLAKSSSSNSEYSFYLFDLFHYSESSSNLVRRKYFINYLLKSQPTSDSDLSFQNIYLSSKKLSDWITPTGFNLIRGNTQEFQTTIEYSRPEPIRLFDNDELKIEISFQVARRFQNRRQELIEETPLLNISVKKAHSLNEIFPVVKSIERFFMLLWEKPHFFHEVSLNSIDGNNYELWSHRDSVSGIDKRTIDFKEFTSKSHMVLGNWQEISSHFDLPIRSFFFAFSDNKLGIYNRFLNYLFALEQLHRTCFRPSEPLSSKNERMTQKAFDEVSADTRSWLEKILNISKNIQIRDRLIELRDYCSYDELNNDEINKAKETRHYLVHLDGNRKPNSFDAKDLIGVNEKLCNLFFRTLKKIVIEESDYPLKKTVS